MNEKLKKYLIVLAYQAGLAAILFLLVLGLNRFAPEMTDKISAIWTKNTNLKKAESLLLSICKELIPF